MEPNALLYLCRTIGNLSGIPARVYSGEELLCFHSVVPLPCDPMDLFRSEIMAVRDHIGYFITPRFHLYGIVNAGPVRFVIGPTAQIMAGDQSLRELAFELDVPHEETQPFVDAMKAITRMPFDSLLLMLCPVNYFLNGEMLELKDIAIRGADQTAIKQSVEERRTERVYEQEAAALPHNTLRLEETLTDLIRRGDTAALRQWASSAPAVRGGIIAPDQLRQLKNTFVVTATLASRSAIRGGMDAEDALSLSDAFIRRAELLADPAALTNLQYSMVLEFTEQVEKVRRGRNPSRLATEVANYVQHHLSEPIRTDRMAKEFYLSRTYLSAKFKKETGQTLTDFILNEKTEEAKRLLRYSDKSAAAIGAYLGFSSHSHFARVFRTYAGMTPNEYRDRYA